MMITLNTGNVLRTAKRKKQWKNPFWIIRNFSYCAMKVQLAVFPVRLGRVHFNYAS